MSHALKVTVSIPQTIHISEEEVANLAIRQLRRAAGWNSDTYLDERKGKMIEEIEYPHGSPSFRTLRSPTMMDWATHNAIKLVRKTAK